MNEKKNMNDHTLYYKYVKKAGDCLPILAVVLFVCCMTLSGCRRDELCFFHPDGASIVVEIDWDKLAKVQPNAATVLIYNSEDGNLFREELLTANRNRHILRNMPVGQYDFVVFNETRSGSHFDQTIGFRNYTNRDIFEAFVLPDEVGGRYAGLGFNSSSSTRTIYTNPDTLSADRLFHYEITPRMIDIVHVDPEPLNHGKEYPISDTIRFVPQRVISVTNVTLKGNNLASIGSYSCYLTGMSESYRFGPDRYSTNPVTYPIVFTQITRSGSLKEVTSLGTSFSVMGLQDDISPEEYKKENEYIVELRMVLLNGDIHIERFDLIKDKCMNRSRKFINNKPHDIIDIELKVDLPYIPAEGGGGIVTDIEDWEDQTVPLETTVLRFHPNQGSGTMVPIRRNINTNIVLPLCEFSPPTEPKEWIFRFKEWNTSNDGKGTGYQPESIFRMPRGGAVLYAIWEKVE